MTKSRRIIFDTETTGSSYADRIIEIGMIEVIGSEITGRQFYSRFEPDGHPIHFGAQRVHGISNAQLLGEPRFADRLHEIIDFVGDSIMLAHNAAFDSRMLESELSRSRHPGFGRDRYVCTMPMAKKAFPGEKINIDALMTRLLPGEKRGIHSALEDAMILARIVNILEARQKQVQIRPTHKEAGVTPNRPSHSVGGLPRSVGEGISEDLARAISNAKTIEVAVDLRTGGSDVWSKADRDHMRSVLDGHVDVDDFIDATLGRLDERGADAALRWVCRGLEPTLAIFMQEQFMKGREPTPRPDEDPVPDF